jgi:hypothetical protein
MEIFYLFVRSVPQVNTINGLYWRGHVVSSHMSNLKLLIGFRLKLVLKFYTENRRAIYVLPFRMCEIKA